MSIRPDFCTVPSSIRSLDADHAQPRCSRALDLGAGIGRVTRDVLLPLLDEVVLVEPVQKFLAKARDSSKSWPGISGSTKHVSFVLQPLQKFDPGAPLRSSTTFEGCPLSERQLDDTGYDVIWMQWCLGHLHDEGLVALLRRCKAALRKPLPADGTRKGTIFVKENCCADSDGQPLVSFCSEDSTLTRSNLAWLAAFAAAGLTIIRNELQAGLPEGLYPVRTFVLR